MKHSDNKRRHMKQARAALAIVLTACFVVTAAVTDEVYAAGGYESPFKSSSYSINGRFGSSLIVNGVDVSYWQPSDSNFIKAKAAGSDFAIMRVTYTNYGPSDLRLNPDSKFSSFYNKAKAAGMMKGVYVFSQAKSASEGAQEAEYAVRRLRALGIYPKDLELPVYMDYEFAGGVLGRMHGISKTASTNAAVAFCNRIKAYGYTPGIYANLSFFNNQIDRSRFSSDVDIWCAQYNSSCGLSGNYSKWQYASDGQVSGINGKTDINFWFINQAGHKSDVTTIKGDTEMTLAEASRPTFDIYDGETLLQNGRDYIIGTIGGNKAISQRYAYIKGIGAYGGYALVPITINNAAQTASDEETSVETGEEADAKVISCANYMTRAVKSNSSYISVSSSVRATKIRSLKRRRKGFYVKVYKKNKANASGYQVRYSLRKNMSGSVVKTVGTRYNRVSKTIKTGKAKRRYYVQVRTYQDKGGLRFYSRWSSVRSVRTR